jgi:hypothetical protein
VRHRRQAHRFPVRIEAAYGAEDEIPRLSATVHDLNPFGLAMRVRESIPHDRRLRVTLLLDSGPLEIVGAVTRAEKASADAFDIGVRFEDLPQNKQDTIMRWCFARPFGPDSPVQDEGSRGEALDPARVGTGQSTGTDRRTSTPSRRPTVSTRGPAGREHDAVPATSEP